MATGQHVFATPPSVPGELDGGDGSEANPFHSVQKAMTEIQADGGVVHLHGGQYVESIRLEDFGQNGAQMVVQPVGDGEVFLDGILSEFLAPQGDVDRWEPIVPDSGEFAGEYVWLRPYELVPPVSGGAFLDEPVHTRLVGYHRREDLTAPGQLWPDHAVTGNRLWRLHPDQANFPDRYKPEDRNNRPHWRPWVYMGPGIWFDPEVRPDEPGKVGGRRVHIRLSPTENNIPGWPDYDPETTDPNHVRLALSQNEQRAIFLVNSQHVRFENLTLRFGHPETIRLRNCTDIVFDHCRIRSGSRAIFLNAEGPGGVCQDISIQHCEIDGGIPTWFFRSDRKDQYRFGPDPADPDTTAAKDELCLNLLGHSTSGVQISGKAGSVGVTVHHCEIFNAHDSYVFGENTEFHHNWVHNLNDDGIAFSSDAETKNAKVYGNVVTQCLTALSFGGGAAVESVYIYGNLFDLREPTLGKRPTGEGVAESLRQGHLVKYNGSEKPIFLFHNTCLVFDPGAKGDNLEGNKAGFAYYSGVAASEAREAYNNIFVAAFTPADHLKPIAFLPPDESGPTDGNTYLRIPASGTADGSMDDNFLVQDVGVPEFEFFPTLDDYQAKYWPSDEAHEYEHDGHVGDPGFKSLDTGTGRPHRGDDLRLRHHPQSQAKDTAVEMPQELTDFYTDAIGTPPTDRGCYPSTGARLQVGVDGRMVFPWIRPRLGPQTHADGDLAVAPTPGTDDR